jgi:probable HAF family extracellular repeat protein
MPRRVLKLLSFLLLGVTWVFAAQAAEYNPADYTFTSLDYPGAPSAQFAGTGISGINNKGQMVGGYGTWSPKQSHGLLYANGNFTVFDYPESTLNSSTAGAGINDAGTIVGGYNLNVDDSGGNRGFIRSGGTYTPLAVPTAQYNTTAADINNLGIIVGAYDYSFAPLVTHSFIYDGTYNTFYHPGYYNTVASGINAAGLIVGSVTDGAGSHGFLLNGSTYTILDYPGANQTNAVKINRSGDIAGFYTTKLFNNDIRHGFIYSKGKYYAFDVPFQAVWTMLTGINDAGWIAGTWVDSKYVGHGFLAIPKRSKNAFAPLDLLLD